jgi:hypothetical protein
MTISRFYIVMRAVGTYTSEALGGLLDCIQQVLDFLIDALFLGLEGYVRLLDYQC